MVNDWQGRDSALSRLWDAIETRRIGMLGLTKSGLHAEPMLAFVERRRKRLWFVARTDTDMVQSVGGGAPCMFVLQDDALIASIAGELCLVEDRRRMLRCWNAKVAAWLPEGPHDARLTMLRMDCVDAEVWISGQGLTKFAWEIALPGARPQFLQVDGRPQATFH
jgi:general stress protein 26